MHSDDVPGDRFGLSGVVVADEALDETLLRVAHLAVHYVGGADMAGITLLREGKAVTAVFTDPTAPEVDTAQYRTGNGPCLDAFRTRSVYRIDDTRDDDRWPEFAATAAAAGLLSTLSLPLLVGEHGLGALNLYSYERCSFVEEGTEGIFAAQAAVVLANADAYWAAQRLAEQLETALQSRAIIEQAKGILMARHRCSADDAFARLREESQRTNRKLRTVAAEVVDGMAAE